jgi:hypothetical protein
MFGAKGDGVADDTTAIRTPSRLARGDGLFDAINSNFRVQRWRTP